MSWELHLEETIPHFALNLTQSWDFLVLKTKYAQILLRDCRERKENICEDSAFVCVKLSWLKDLNDTLLVASLLKNTGLVVANDAKKERTKALVANIHRLGEFCSSVLIIYIGSICVTFLCFTPMATEKEGVKLRRSFYS